MSLKAAQRRRHRTHSSHRRAAGGERSSGQRGWEQTFDGESEVALVSFELLAGDAHRHETAAPIALQA